MPSLVPNCMANTAVQFARSNAAREIPMDKQHVKGGVKDAKGKVKEAAGKATGDRETEGSGKADQAEGKFRKAVGDVKDALKRFKR